MTLLSLLGLYFLFRFKQLACDFLLQTKWMAMGKGEEGWIGYKPLLSHAAIHGAGTLVIFLIYLPSFWWVAAVDILIHAVVDRLKARLTDKMHWSPSNWKFWWAFGIDQEAHNITHVAYIIVIVTQLGLIT